MRCRSRSGRETYRGTVEVEAERGIDGDEKDEEKLVRIRCVTVLSMYVQS